MAGELYGTDINLAVETTPAGGTFADIGGVTTQSLTMNAALVDITNKSSAGWRLLLAGKGLRTVDISASVVFSSDANFLIAKAGYESQALLNYQISRGGELITGAFKIASWSETQDDNGAIVVALTLNSSGEVTIV